MNYGIRVNLLEAVVLSVAELASEDEAAEEEAIMEVGWEEGR
jgi:hypothetical protein